jgi:hypothetical protein
VKNSNKILTMKKLVLILMGLLFSYISFAQEEKREMSNYEKYILQKEMASQDTVVKTDTVYVEQEKPEYDDLYYTPSKDQLKLKSKELRLRKKEIRMEQDSLYYDAKEEVYEDLSFTAQIYRFHRPYYGFGYYNYYWDPFYDPWFLDSWYYGYTPWYGGWGYPYYRSSWYFGFSWGYPYYHYPYYHFPYYHYDNNYYGSNYGHNTIYNRNTYNNIAYGRRERPSNLTSTTTRREPVTINRTVQVDRSTGRTLSVTEGNRRVAPTTTTRNTDLQRNSQTQERRLVTTQPSKSTSPIQNRPAYNSGERKTYTPTYDQPRLSTRPQYNNSNTNRVNSYNSSAERRTVTPSQSSTQNRSSYSTPPSRSYSTPSRSYNSGSSSSSSRSSGSSYSAPSRSSSGSSYSGGSSSSSSGSSSSGGSRSSSSGSSSGRR